MKSLWVLLFCAGAASAAPYTLASGDTLWDLAVQRYGDPSFVRELKSVNGIKDPRQIGPGTPVTKIELPDAGAMKRLRAAKTPAEKDAALSAAKGGGSSPSAAPSAAPAGAPTEDRPLDALAESSVPSLAP